MGAAPYLEMVVSQIADLVRRRPLLACLFLGSVLAGLGAAFVRVRDAPLAAARRSLAERDVETALAQLLALERTNPTSGEIQFWLARCSRRLGRLHDAQEHLRRAAVLGFDSQKIQREEWLSLAQAGQLSAAEPHREELLLDPRGDSPEICEAFVNGYLRNYRFGDAVKLIEAWQADFPADPQPRYCRGLLWQHMLELKKAADEFEAAVNLSPQRNDLRLALAAVQIELHDYGQAAENYRKCLQADAQSEPAQLGMAKCLLEQGREEESRRLLEAVLKRHPKHAEARLQLGQLELAAGKHDQALRLLEPLLAERERDLRLRYALAASLQAAGRADEAQPHFDFVNRANAALTVVRKEIMDVQERPRQVEPRYRIGVALLEFAAPGEGLAWLHSVSELEPDHRPTLRALARHYSDSANLELAEKYERRSEQADTESTSRP